MINVWLQAFRLRTLPLSLACIGMGSFLAGAIHQFNLMVFVYSSLTTLFLQILSNLANDYGDSIHGADHGDRQGPSRATQSGKISKRSMITAIIIFAVLSFVSGIALLYYSTNSQFQFLLFLGLGILAILAAIMYTMGKKPYGYAGLGDLSVFLFFGWVGVFGTFFLHTQMLDWSILLPASSCSFFAVAVLNINNLRDVDSDEKAGKKSIPVRIGRKKAIQYHWLLLISGLLCAIIYMALNFKNEFQFLFLLVVPLLYLNARAVYTKTEPKDLDPYVKQMALTSLIFVILFGIGQII
jgi:1,4-dihydroxy-2-naphthoate octaprenyltransferase